MKDRFIALDWGTSKLQAYWLDASGQLLDSKRFEAGIGKIKRVDIEKIVADLSEQWPSECFFASGMIGSNLGWESAPYVQCPATITDISKNLLSVKIGGASGYIVPGLSCTSFFESAEMLRGEEMEIFGWLANADERDSKQLICLPGTHTKWVVSEERQVHHFCTHMTSEMYDCLAKNSVLGNQLSTCQHHSAAFLKGIREGASKGVGLSRLLFGVRAKHIFQQLSLNESPSYCRGILIGAELKDVFDAYKPKKLKSNIPVIGNSTLSHLYVSAIKSLGYGAQYVTSQDALRCGYTAIFKANRGNIDD